MDVVHVPHSHSHLHSDSLNSNAVLPYTPIFLINRRGEHCENCLSHVRSIFCDEAEKNCNRRHVPELLTCARCKEVRYCSRECQRAQWVEHKFPCQAHLRFITVLSLLEPETQRIFKAFVKFCKAINGYLEEPALSALELHLGKERLNTHVFFIKVRAKVTIFKKNSHGTRGWITFKLISAECRTMEQMHDFLDWRCGPLATPAVTEFTLAHRPNLLRIFVVDISQLLPIPFDGYTLPTETSNWPPDHHLKYDEDWLDNLFESIGQPRSGPMAGRDEIASSFFSLTEDEQRLQCLAPARPSSPTGL